MRSWVNLVLFSILVALAVQLLHLYQQNHNLKEEFSKIDAELNSLSKENSILQADLDYFSNHDNLAKELRARLNYKSPGEKLFIIVPPKENN